MTEKKFFNVLIALLCYFVFVGCSKDDIKPLDELNSPEQSLTSTPEPSEQDEYFVHYYCAKYSELSYTAADGENVGWNNRNKPLDVTIGPVRKGFHASLKGNCSMNAAKGPTAGIQISKNGGPWVDKCLVNITSYYSGNVSLSYTIDF